MYETFLRPVLFKFNPERVHDFFIWLGERLGNSAVGRSIVSFFCEYDHPALRTKVAGIDFKNPVGLAAGFDKDVRLTQIIPSVGFGFMEAGAVTFHSYGGNQGTRLVRLPEDKSLIVYYGLKSVGAQAVLDRIRGLEFKIPTGINVAKTNRGDIKGKKSIEDYVNTYKLLGPHFAYVTLNVSCPNAQDGCMFQDPRLLDELLRAIGDEEKHCPIFLKVSSHLTFQEMDDILAVVAKYRFVDGFVIANLSKRRDLLGLRSPRELLNLVPDGGISGKPLREMSTNLIRYVYGKTRGRYAIIGLGGIFDAQDAYDKIKAGASLVQIITGLIYGGPMTVKKINLGLVKLLEKDRYRNVSEAVGKSVG